MVRRKAKQKRKTNYKKLNLPGLNSSKQSRLNKEYVDYDYVGDLSPEEQKFLSKFSQEYYSGTFEPDDPDAEDKTYTYDNFDKETGKGNIAKSHDEQKADYRRNNIKLKDIHGQITAFSGFKNYDNLELEGATDDIVNELLDQAAKHPNIVKKFKKKQASNKPVSLKTKDPKPKKLLE